MIIRRTVTTDNGPVVVDPTPTPEPTFRFTWFGTDGSEWDLVQGPAWLLSGTRGYGMPTPQHWLRESPGLDGATWDGLRLPPREVYMPVEIHAPDDIIGVDRAFFSGLNPRLEGKLRVTAPGGKYREIACRYVEGAEGELETDPHLVGRVVYPLRMVACNPYWRGEPVSLQVRQGTALPFFPGPPFHIAPGLSFSNAPITNPGDEPSYAVKRMHGPYSGFTVDIGGSLVSMEIDKAAGEWVDVDMRPDYGTFTDETGADVSAHVTARSFAAIPVGDTTISLTFTDEGTGTGADISFDTYYWRAW